MSIKLKLGMAFAVVLILFAGTAFFALNTLGGTYRSLDSLVNVSAERVRLAGGIKENMLEISRAERNIILASTAEEMDGFATRIEDLRGEIRDGQERLRDLASEQAQRQLDDFAAALDDYLAISGEVRDLARLNSNVWAREISATTAREYMTRSMESLDAVHRAAERATSAAAQQANLLSLEIERGLLMAVRFEKNTILATTEEEM